MLKKISDNPHNYESDSPQEDMKRFEDAMVRLVKVPPKHKKPKDTADKQSCDKTKRI